MSRMDEVFGKDNARKADTDCRTRSLLNQLRALHPGSDITITPAA